MRSFKSAIVVFFSAASLLNAAPNSTTVTETAEMPLWEKFSVSVGAFLSDTQSGARVGSGLGVDINLEDLLGLEAKTTVLRADAFWRFSKNKRHRVDGSWFSLRRDARRTVGEDFDIKNQHGDTVTINAGTEVSSHFNLDIIEAAYSYSFIQDDRIDLAGVAGVYAMPIDFGLSASGLAEGDGKLAFTAPLPVVGMRLDVALTPKWYLRTGSQFFYVQYKNFTGRLTQMRAAVEYLPVKHVGIGLGVDTMRFGLEGRDNDYPGVDLKGSIDFQYTGLQLYAKTRF